MIGTSNQLELGCVPGKTSGFYVKKQKILQGADALQGICIGKVNGMFDGNHAGHSFYHGSMCLYTR